MAFITLNTVLTDRFVVALCNTLVHSLWQGILLAAITGLIIIFTRKASSAARYNLLIATLVLFTIGIAVMVVAFVSLALSASKTTSPDAAHAEAKSKLVLKEPVLGEAIA